MDDRIDGKLAEMVIQYFDECGIKDNIRFINVTLSEREMPLTLTKAQTDIFDAFKAAYALTSKEGATGLPDPSFKFYAARLLVRQGNEQR